jgi:hypothetical protein
MNLRALAGFGVEFQATAREGRSFLHTKQSQASPLHSLAAQSSHIESYAIIAYSQVQVAVAPAKVDRNRSGARVTHNIR